MLNEGLPFRIAYLQKARQTEAFNYTVRHVDLMRITRALGGRHDSAPNEGLRVQHGTCFSIVYRIGASGYKSCGRAVGRVSGRVVVCKQHLTQLDSGRQLLVEAEEVALGVGAAAYEAGNGALSVALRRDAAPR